MQGLINYVLSRHVQYRITSYNVCYTKLLRIPTVENVQDLVEKMLIERGHARVAKAYIIYREQHRRIRDGRDLLNEGLELIDDYLKRADWRVNENSNMSYSLQGLNNHISTSITAKYWLERIVITSYSIHYTKLYEYIAHVEYTVYIK